MLRSFIHSSRPIVCLALIAAVVAATAGLASAEFQVNTYTTHDQNYPSVAMDAAGNFVAVWTSIYQDGDLGGIYGRKYNALGQPLTDEFLINSTTAGHQKYPDIAMNSSGDFVVGWSSNDVSSEGTWARRFNSNGTPIGSEFQVNTFTNSRQLRPNLAMNDAGAFVVAWESNKVVDDNHHLADWRIAGRAYDATGTALGAEFEATQYGMVSYQNTRRPKVAISQTGDFSVVWQTSWSTDTGPIPQGTHVRGRFYNADGSPYGDADYLTSNVEFGPSPSIEMAENGYNFVTWSYNKSFDDNSFEHLGQWFDAEGNEIGEEILLHSFESDLIQSLQTAQNSDGQRLYVWAEGDLDERDIYALMLDSDGTTIGEQIQLGSDLAYDQYLPVMAMNDAGQYVVLWQSIGQDGDRHGIYAEVGTIPEPAMLSLLAVGGVAMLRRRRRG